MTDINTLTMLADELFDAEAEVQRLNAELQTAQKKVQRLSEIDIPEAMDDLGVDEIKTKSGLTVKVSDDVKAGNLKRLPGLSWLREHGEGGCIKTNVLVPFAKGSDADADEFLERLRGEGIAAEKSAEVNHMTLKSIIRKKLEAGEEVPLEILGAFQFRKAKIEAKK